MKNKKIKILSWISMGLALWPVTLISPLTFAVGGKEEEKGRKETASTHEEFSHLGSLPVELYPHIFEQLALNGDVKGIHALDVTSKAFHNVFGNKGVRDHLEENLGLQRIHVLIRRMNQWEASVSPLDMIEVHGQLLNLFGIKILPDGRSRRHAYFFAHNGRKLGDEAKKRLQPQIDEFYKILVSHVPSALEPYAPEGTPVTACSNLPRRSWCQQDVIEHICLSPLLTETSYHSLLNLAKEYVDQRRFDRTGGKTDVRSVFSTIACCLPESYIDSFLMLLDFPDPDEENEEDKKFHKDTLLDDILCKLFRGKKIPYQQIKEKVMLPNVDKISTEAYQDLAHASGLSPLDIEELLIILLSGGDLNISDIYRALACNHSLHPDTLREAHELMLSTPTETPEELNLIMQDVYPEFIHNPNSSANILCLAYPHIKEIAAPYEGTNEFQLAHREETQMLREAGRKKLLKLLFHHPNAPEELKQKIKEGFPDLDLELGEEYEYLRGVRLN